MSMKVQLKNIGILKQAEFSLGDITIICGNNNTGKTYTAYILYGFLRSWRRLIDFPISDQQVNSLLEDGSLKIDISQYLELADQKLEEACKRYHERLDSMMAAPEGTFQNSEFHIETNEIHIQDEGFEFETGLNQEPFIITTKEKGSDVLLFTLAVNRKKKMSIDSIFAKDAVSYAIGESIFATTFPNPFISSVERTGAAIFAKELNFARNRLLEEIGRTDKNIDPRELLLKSYQNYPAPVEDNVEFTRLLSENTKKKEFYYKKLS